MSMDTRPVGTTPPDPSSAPQGLRELALRLLEFPAVRQRLTAHTTFAVGRELALTLRPSYRDEEVVRLQKETAEGRHFLESGADLDLSGARDVRATAQRAQRGGVLSGQELLEVLDTLKAARSVRTGFQRRRGEFPSLAGLSESLPDLRELEEGIQRCIGRHGEVLESATPALQSARAEARLAYQRLVEALARIMRSSLGQHVLQESLVVEREGRLVLPVKVEHRNRLPGLVHDVSESGATVFVEPLAMVPLGNRWRELRRAEEREVERVLHTLSGMAGAHGDELTAAVEILGRLDLILAKARYARATASVAPGTVLAEEPYLKLVEARHPLLREPVVPITLELGREWKVLLVTGPNAGGKTVALKTTGLLALMHQAGLQIPAAPGSVLTVFEGVYADIGDQQSIERSLSTFSSHVQGIRDILAQATSSSLVLLDELGTSTDPEEGAALARALVSHFLHQGIPLIATTHQRQVAAYVQETRGMLNASVELDPVTLAPTYRLTLGLPGRSYALAIASRLGLPEPILSQARTFLHPTHRQVEELLSQIQEERRLAALKLQEAEAAQAGAQALQRELEERLERLQAQERVLLEEARQRVQAQAEEMLERLRRVERAVTVPALQKPPPEEVHSARSVVREVQKALRSQEWQPPAPSPPRWLERLQPGDRVWVRGFPQPVEVLSPPDERGTVEVLLGTMRARVRTEQLERPAPSAEARKATWKVSLAQPAPQARRQEASGEERGAEDSGAPGTELDLRGLRVEAALERLEAFLDRAVLEGLAQVRIIHGAGTGALRQAVRERLAEHPLVKSSGPEEHRGDGTTLVRLA
ncbi:MAG: endonuclease MutS2 [Chloroflexi bacterium]|nr:endonuclease MutS2 [Chloroflexota bacterium]